MAALDEWGLHPNGQLSVPSQKVDQVRGVLKEEAWAWFEANKDEVVLTLNLIIFRRQVRLGDLRPLWVRIFGAQG
jgi:hypothetical protein